MSNVSNEWLTLVQYQKPLEIHLQQRKWDKLEDFPYLSQENASENDLDLVSSSMGKKRSPDGFFSLLRMVISLSIFETRTLRT